MVDFITVLEKTNIPNTMIYNYYYEELKQYDIDMYKWGDVKNGDTDIINYIMDNINTLYLEQNTIDIVLLSAFAQLQDINIIKKLVETYNGNIYAKIKIEDNIYSCFDFVQWSEFGSSYMDYLLEKYEKDNIIPPITDNTLYQIMSVWGDINLFVRALKLCKKYKIKIHTYEHMIYNIFHKFQFDYIMPIIHHTKKKHIFIIPDYIDINEWINYGNVHPYDSHLWYYTAINMEQLGLVVINRKIIL